MEYLKMWPSFSLKLEEAFHFEDGTCSSIVDLILDMAEKDVENGIEKSATVYPGKIPSELHRPEGNWVWKGVSFQLIEQ